MFPPVKNLVKMALGVLCKRFLLSRNPFRDGNIVLLYHRVVPRQLGLESEPAMFVAPETLEMHIRELSEVFRLESVDGILQSGGSSRPLCAITFDDGWVDNYQFAFPILRRRGVPATIYLPVSMIGTERRFWFQDLYALALRAQAQGWCNDLQKYLSAEAGYPVRTSGGPSGVVSAMKKVPPDRLEKVLAKADPVFGGGGSQKRSVLNWKEISEMGLQGIRFGAHGMTHRILTGLDPERKEREILTSLETLQEQGVAFSNTFSYPNGDHDSDCIRTLKRAGCTGALTTQMGYNTRSSNPFRLRRIPLHEHIGGNTALLWFRVFQALRAGA